MAGQWYDAVTYRVPTGVPESSRFGYSDRNGEVIDGHSRLRTGARAVEREGEERRGTVYVDADGQTWRDV